ncbi:MAG: nicotinate-nucleotide adenylyltransferase [Pseudomonadales bacterium]
MICLFGGTFDPVHLGHLHGARAVCAALHLEQIHLVLSSRPGHRGAPGASVSERWDMLVLACADDSRLCPDDREVRRAESGARPSYTIDTLEALRAEHPAEALLWVLGRDAFNGLSSWHRWGELLDLCHLVVLERPGASIAPDVEVARLYAARRVRSLPAAPAGAILPLEAPLQDISATAIRRALAAGEPAAHLLPAAVYTYITDHGLYGAMRDA